MEVFYPKDEGSRLLLIISCSLITLEGRNGLINLSGTDDTMNILNT